MTWNYKHLIQEGLKSGPVYFYPHCSLKTGSSPFQVVGDGGRMRTDPSKEATYWAYKKDGGAVIFPARCRDILKFCYFVRSLFFMLASRNRMSYRFIWSCDQRLHLTHSSDRPSWSTLPLSSVVVPTCPSHMPSLTPADFQRPAPFPISGLHGESGSCWKRMISFSPIPKWPANCIHTCSLPEPKHHRLRRFLSSWSLFYSQGPKSVPPK